MIIDCHAHVFTHWIGACGHPTRDIHNRYLQRMITRTAASTFRTRDWAPADTKALYRADDAGWKRAHRRRFPRRPLRPARVHARGRGPCHPVHAGRHAGDGGAAGADAGADDVCRRRSLPAAGGRRLRGDDGDERLRPASVPDAHDRADACRRGDGGHRARARQGRPRLRRAEAPRSLLQRQFDEPPRLSLAARRAGDGAVLGQARAPGHRALPRAELRADLRRGGLHGSYRGAGTDTGAPSRPPRCTWR